MRPNEGVWMQQVQWMLRLYGGGRLSIKPAQVAQCGSGDYGGNIRKTSFGVIPTRLKHAMGYKSLGCDIN